MLKESELTAEYAELKPQARRKQGRKKVGAAAEYADKASIMHITRSWAKELLCGKVDTFNAHSKVDEA